MTAQAPTVAFRPRRLGHANLYVRDLEASMAFYNGVCGLEEVYREPEVSAGFLSNGNTHHDLGLMQAKVRGGGTFVTKASEVTKIVARNLEPGLNHLGWEMNTKDELIAAWLRAKASPAVRITRTVNHQITHSIYVEDPDGNQHEFYADQLEDWRTIFRPAHDELLTVHWDPSNEPHSDRAFWRDVTEFRTVPEAIFHPRAITHVGLIAKDFPAMRDFFENVAGLDVNTEASSEDALFFTGQSRISLLLFAPRPNPGAGLRYIAFELSDAGELSQALRRSQAAGIPVETVSAVGDARGAVLRDPDGLSVLLYASLSPRQLLSLGSAIIA